MATESYVLRVGDSTIATAFSARTSRVSGFFAPATQSAYSLRCAGDSASKADFTAGFFASNA